MLVISEDMDWEPSAHQERLAFLEGCFDGQELLIKDVVVLIH